MSVLATYTRLAPRNRYQTFGRATSNCCKEGPDRLQNNISYRQPKQKICDRKMLLLSRKCNCKIFFIPPKREWIQCLLYSNRSNSHTLSNCLHWCFSRLHRPGYQLGIGPIGMISRPIPRGGQWGLTTHEWVVMNFPHIGTVYVHCSDSTRQEGLPVHRAIFSVAMKLLTKCIMMMRDKVCGQVFVAWLFSHKSRYMFLNVVVVFFACLQ